MSYSDPCPNLSLAIDVAGDKYYLGTDRTVELGYKSRKDFLNAFGDNTDTICLLRKYMPIANDLSKTVFDSEEERTRLVQILEARAGALKASNQFNSSILKNIVIQRNYTGLLKAIEVLKGEPYKPKDFGLKEKLKGLKGAVPSAFTPTSVYKEYAMKLTDEQKIQLVLEMSWFLMHPELVPKKAQRRWFKLVKRLDMLRLDEFAGLSSKIQELMQKNPGKPLLDYFKSINLGKAMGLSNISDLNTIQPTTLDEIFMLGCEQDKSVLEDRLRTILQLLKAKEYLSDAQIQQLEDLRNKDAGDILNDLSGSIVESPGMPPEIVQSGGAEEKEISHGLRKSLIPFFDYFSGMYDPVYGVLDGAISQINPSDKPSVEELVRLFNIVSKINPENDPKKYGVYRLVGFQKSVVEFVRHLIKSTEFHTDKLSDSEKKEYFEDLEKLPRIRLSSVVNQFSSTYKDPTTLPFVSLMLIGAGITIKEKGDIEDPNNGFISKSMKSHGVSSANKTLASLNFGQIQDAITEYFGGAKSESESESDNIYIVCNSDNTKLPLVLYDIDINTVKLDDTAIYGVLLENNYFNKLTVGNDPLYLDDLLGIDNENILNEAGFALAIFISLKDLFNE